MPDDTLGLSEASAIGIGAMVGGGAFAVLGVLVGLAEAATWLAFTLAGAFAACGAYSYLALNRRADERGGAVAMVEQFHGRPSVTGLVGWALIVGYVSSMAMYAVAFGGVARELLVPVDVALPLQPVLSVLVVLGVIGLNVAGTRVAGETEELLVGLLVLVLAAIGVTGLAHVIRVDRLALGLRQVDEISFVMAVAVAFVSVLGWQLLLYDQERMTAPERTLPRAIAVALVVGVLLDMVVALLATSLVSPMVISADPELAVALATESFLGTGGILAVALAALAATGGAVNATLFSAAFLGRRLVADEFLPERLALQDRSGIPRRPVLVLGGVAAMIAATGRLQAITAVGSLGFVGVFAVINALAFRAASQAEHRRLVPALGVLGSAVAGPLLGYRLWRDERDVFLVVVILTFGLLILEIVFIERERGHLGSTDPEG